jgi:hypothetical protein
VTQCDWSMPTAGSEVEMTSSSTSPEDRSGAPVETVYVNDEDDEETVPVTIAYDADPDRNARFSFKRLLLFSGAPCEKPAPPFS